MLKITDLTRLAEALSGIELIQEIDQLKAEVNSHRPISKEIQDRIFQKFRLDWNYNSNAIEGNKLTYGETVALLMHGITAKGKPLKDHMDVKGHNEAINLLLDIVKSERDFTQNDIRSLHEIILVEAYSSKTITADGIPATRNISIGQYKTAPNHVKTRTGEMHYYASPAETPALMDELMDWYEAAKQNDKIHPFIIASLFHHRFVSIHPFDDGNGRMTRILMNLILMRNQYPLIVVPMKLREEYYGVLSQADVNDFEPLIQYFGGLLKHSLEIQLKGIRGERISEPDDIDKEISILKRSLPKENKLTNVKDKENINRLLNNSVIPLFTKGKEKLNQFNDLFLVCNEEVVIFSSGRTRKQPLHDFIYLNKHYNDINTIKYRVEWLGFKKLNPTFNLSTDITFIFNEITYEVFEQNSEVKTFRRGIKKLNSITNYYHENLSEENINQIVLKLAKSIIEVITKKTESI